MTDDQLFDSLVFVIAWASHRESKWSKKYTCRYSRSTRWHGPITYRINSTRQVTNEVRRRSQKENIILEDKTS